MTYILKIVNVLLLSTIKYFYTPIYAHTIGLDFWSTLITMVIGGVLGFLVYYYFSNILILSSKHLKPKLKKLLPESAIISYRNYIEKRKAKRKKKRKFTRRNRFMVKFGREYGMISLILLTPVLVSLVLGAFLLRRYYNNNPLALPLMLLSIVVEGTILVVIYYYFMGSL